MRFRQRQIKKNAKKYGVIYKKYWMSNRVIKTIGKLYITENDIELIKNWNCWISGYEPITYVFTGTYNHNFGG